MLGKWIFSSPELLLHLLHPFSFTSLVPFRVLAECRAPETCMYLCRNDACSNSTNQAVYKAYWQEPLNCIHKSLVDLTSASLHPANQHSYRVWVWLSLQLNVWRMQGIIDGKKCVLNTGLRSEQKQTLLCIFLLSKEGWRVRWTNKFFLTIYNEQDLKERNAKRELISPFPLPIFMFSSVLEDLEPECSGPKVWLCFGTIFDLSDSYSPLSSKSCNAHHHLLASSTASADSWSCLTFSHSLSSCRRIFLEVFLV